MENLEYCKILKRNKLIGTVTLFTTNTRTSEWLDLSCLSIKLYPIILSNFTCTLLLIYIPQIRLYFYTLTVYLNLPTPLLIPSSYITDLLSEAQPSEGSLKGSFGETLILSLSENACILPSFFKKNQFVGQRIPG